MWARRAMSCAYTHTYGQTDVHAFIRTNIQYMHASIQTYAHPCNANNRQNTAHIHTVWKKRFAALYVPKRMALRAPTPTMGGTIPRYSAITPSVRTICRTQSMMPLYWLDVCMRTCTVSMQRVNQCRDSTVATSVHDLLSVD